MPKVLQNPKKQPSAKLIAWRKKFVGDLVDTCNSENLLSDAVRSNKRDLVRRIIDVRPSYLNRKDDDGCFPLNWCVNDDKIDMFKYLHTRGGNINTNISGCDPTLLHEAVMGKHVKIVEYILCHCNPSLLNVCDIDLHHNALDRANMCMVNTQHDTTNWIHTMIKNYMNLDDILYDENIEDSIYDLSKEHIDMDNIKDIQKIFYALFSHNESAFYEEEYNQLTGEKTNEILSYLKHKMKILSEELEEIESEEEINISKVFESEVESETAEESVNESVIESIDDSVDESADESAESEQEYFMTAESWKVLRPGHKM